MGQQITVWLLSIFVLLLIAATFLYFYIRSFLEESQEYWKLLLKKLRLRIDKIPNLIETVRIFSKGEEKLIADLIKLRAAGWPISEPTVHKVQNELAISADLNILWDLAKKIPELSKDTNFLSLKMEFRKLAEEIEMIMEKYNEKIQKYNKFIGFFLIVPLVKIFKFKGLPILELEP